MKMHYCLATVLFTCILTSAGAADATAETTYAALRDARPDGRQLEVHSLVLERDAFRFHFESGVFHLASPVNGETLSAVFLGQGKFRLTPATENEQRHLSMVVGQPDFEVLADSFTQLVLHFTDDTFAELAAAGEVVSGEPSAEAVHVFEKYLELQKKKLRANLQLRLLRDLLREPRRPEGVFIATFEGENLPPAFAAVDPLGADELGLTDRLGSEDTVFFVSDPERGGYWYLSDQKQEIEAGRARPVPRLADAVHYDVETEVLKNTDIRGETKIRFESLTQGERVFPIRLLAELRLTRAEFSRDGAEWRELFFVQEDHQGDGDAAVVFPEPLATGDGVTLRLAYKGEGVLTHVGDNNYVVGARTSWYPNLGIFLDPATFELVYRVPKKSHVVSVGELVEEQEKGAFVTSRWRTRHPIRVAGFNYGRFRQFEKKDETSDLTLRVYTNPGTPDLIRRINEASTRERSPQGPDGEFRARDTRFVGLIDTKKMAKSALNDSINMARVGSMYFGPLPQSHVAITQQSQWSFGQSWPSLVFLPYVAFLTSTHRMQLGDITGHYTSDERLERLGYHEFAHQWWGHLVGWRGYRDQWLSEGFAEFSAGLAVHFTEGWEAYDEFWNNTREVIFRNRPGATLTYDRVGPISQGWRLSTQRAPAAYSAIVYRKGAYVLHMLRMMMREPRNKEPDARFIGMMRDFVATYAGQSPTTADFQAVVERHMTPQMAAQGNGKIDWFFQQWVHGTEIPRYHHDLRLESLGEGHYRIHGGIKQSGVSKDFFALVPVYFDFGKQGVARLGLVNVMGSSRSELDLKVGLPQEPQGVLINAHHDILSKMD